MDLFDTALQVQVPTVHFTQDFIKIFSTVVLFESSHHKKFNDELKFDLDKQFGTY